MEYDICQLVSCVICYYLECKATLAESHSGFILLCECCCCCCCFVQSGPNNMTPVDWGVNYRALHDLFEMSQSREHVYSYEIGVQMLEIYNEQLRDLLATDSSHKKYP